MQLFPVLSQINPHPRDKHIVLRKEDHKYIINGDDGSNQSSNPVRNDNNDTSTPVQPPRYMSVTTWIHTHFNSFEADKVIDNMMKGQRWKEGHKYWGMTKDEIKKQWEEGGKSAAGLGENMHLTIECFMNNPRVEDPYGSSSRGDCPQTPTTKEIEGSVKTKPSKKYTHRDLLEYHWQSGGVMMDDWATFDPENVSGSLERSKDITETEEWKYFLRYVEDFHWLVPYRTEWKIYHEEYGLAGCIDMTYENPDGTIQIWDWKRSKEISREVKFGKYSTTKEICYVPDTNYFHYAMQLSIYKLILEEKYGKKVSFMCLVRLHPNASSYELYEVQEMPQVKMLLEMRRKQRSID